MHGPAALFGWWAGSEVVMVPLLKHYTEQHDKPLIGFKAELKVSLVAKCHLSKLRA